MKQRLSSAILSSIVKRCHTHLVFSSFDFYRKHYLTFRDLSPVALKVLNAFKEQPEVRLQSKSIVEETGLAPAAVALIITNLTVICFS